MSEKIKFCTYCKHNKYHHFGYHNFVEVGIPTKGEWVVCDICFCVHKKKHTKRHLHKCSIRIDPNYRKCGFCRRFIHKDNFDIHYTICYRGYDNRMLRKITDLTIG